MSDPIADILDWYNPKAMVSMRDDTVLRIREQIGRELLEHEWFEVFPKRTTREVCKLEKQEQTGEAGMSVITLAELLFINMDADGMGDTIGCALATYYDNHPDKPENDPIDDETGWSEWVMEQCRSLDERIAKAMEEQE